MKQDMHKYGLVLLHFNLLNFYRSARKIEIAGVEVSGDTCICVWRLLCSQTYHNLQSYRLSNACR